MRDATFDGSECPVYYRVWEPGVEATQIVVIVHGYAEYGGRYAHVADALVAGGAAVYAPDHIGHGRSGGERALIRDFEHVVDDLHHVATTARSEHPGAPLVIVGHSMMEMTSDVAGMSSDPETQRSYAEDPMIYHGLYKRQLLVAEVEALDRFNDELERLTMPVLFMHGVDDPFVPYQTSLDAVLRMPSTDVTIRLFKGDRHELVNERDRSRVIDELVRFVGRF